MPLLTFTSACRRLLIDPLVVTLGAVFLRRVNGRSKPSSRLLISLIFVQDPLKFLFHFITTDITATATHFRDLPPNFAPFPGVELERTLGRGRGRGIAAVHPVGQYVQPDGDETEHGQG
uniref:(northern house mosquito) hypothetical protein n=1 Tax=Culex pipiens TaxID=7175 RepID=A0A8D8G9G4_CULPI